jgi:hypothetical protein
MADDHLNQAQRRWGTSALIFIVGMGCSWLYHAADELLDLVEKVGAARLKDRMSQLKPAAFKFPWTAVYVIATALVCVGIVSWLVVLGVRELRGRGPLPTKRS